MRGEIKPAPPLPILTAAAARPETGVERKGMERKLKVVLALPGEADMPLLSELRSRDDADIVAVVDPAGTSVVAALAEIMGLPVVGALAAVPELEQAVVVLPATPSAAGNDVAAAAEARGVPVIAAGDLRERLARGPIMTSPPAAAATPAAAPDASAPGAVAPLTIARRAMPLADRTVIETRFAAAEAALARLEEGLAFDTLLSSLLDLALAAVDATQGSLMLADAAEATLHIAAARGLGEPTLRRTRVAFGNGIAGRVAQSRRSELVRGVGPTEGRDRPDIAVAASVPLVHEGSLIGVLNVSTSADETPLDDGVVPGLERLAGRLAYLVAHAVQLRRAVRREEIAASCDRLREIAATHDEVPDLLTAWTTVLLDDLAASRVTIAVARADGGLLLAESATGEEGRAWHAPLEDPAWQSVFGGGGPLVVQAIAGEPLTIVYLPLSGSPSASALAAQLPDAGLAADLLEQWPLLAGKLAAILAEHLDRRVGAVREARLLALVWVLADLATVERTPGQRAERVCQAAAELTGAERTAAVVSIEGTGVRLAGGDAPDDAPWLPALPPLIAKAAPQGWRATTLEGDVPPLSVLIATCEPGRQTPALVLVGKQRLHDLDGEGFGPEDGEVASVLATLLRALPAGGRREQPAPLAAGLFEPSPPAVPSPIEPPPSVEASAVDPPAVEPPAVEPPAEVPTLSGGESSLIFALRREMSRCERYHNVFGLLVVRLTPGVLATNLASRLAARLRASDRVFDLGDGEIAILAPEDVQNLDHFERRLHLELGALAGPAAAAAPVSRTVFPGPPTSPQAFLKRARRRD